MQNRLLEGQVAFVTGAGRGLGRAFAKKVAALGCAIKGMACASMASRHSAAPRH